MTRNVARAVCAALLMAMLVAACDNPVDGGQTHIVPRTIIIRAGDQELVRGPRTAITGTLSVKAGTETAPLTVEFLNPDGNVIAAPADFYLRVSVPAAGSGIAQWTQATPGEWAGRLRGLQAGSTNFQFEFMHGAIGSGHAEATFPVPVTITP